MPKVGKNTSPAKKPAVESITCAVCAKSKKPTQFFASASVFHAGTGKIPYCKDCCKSMSLDSNGKVDIEKFKKILKEVDKPFLYDVIQVLYVNNGEDCDIVGNYFRQINSLPQYKGLTWKDSSFDVDKNNINNNLNDSNDDFEITQELVNKWGFGYPSNDYYLAFEKKYQFLKNNYPEKTAMHTEMLLKYIRYSVLEEFSTAKGLIGEAKSWGDLAKNAATAAKINPSQLSAADLTDGLNTIGQIVRAVEQHNDIIPILPKFREQPQDKVDFTLWCYINYIRDLKGLPLCEYADIYKFYDERVKEHKDRFDFLNDKNEEVNNDEFI